jgi:hypothetical protein
MDKPEAAPRVRSSQTGKPWIWSIGIYTGRSPLQLAPGAANNPVLAAGDVTDVSARFIADPFMIKADGLWHMFFEVLNNQNNLGEIGLATSRDGLKWQYREIVLREPFHLSYPYVFRWQDDFYMIPEALGAEAVRLYRATSFPHEWKPVKDLFTGTHADPSIFRFGDRWWMFTCPIPYQHDTLALYSAAELTSEWTEHPMSPVISGNRSIARPGGRVIVYDGGLLRFTQDCVPIYGKQVRAFAITELTSTTYKEHEVPESPVLTPSGDGWNASGMHHVDTHQLEDGSFFACVDGLKNF